MVIILDRGYKRFFYVWGWYCVILFPFIWVVMLVLYFVDSTKKDKSEKPYTTKEENKYRLEGKWVLKSLCKKFVYCFGIMWVIIIAGIFISILFSELI